MSDAWRESVPASVKVARGDAARIELLSASGSGNLWSVEPLEGTTVADARVEVGPMPRPAGNPPAAAGAPVVLVVVGASPGRTRFRVRLARPWEPDDPVVDQEMEVVVT